MKDGLLGQEESSCANETHVDFETCLPEQVPNDSPVVCGDDTEEALMTLQGSHSSASGGPKLHLCDIDDAPVPVHYIHDTSVDLHKTTHALSNRESHSEAEENKKVTSSTISEGSKPSPCDCDGVPAPLPHLAKNDVDVQKSSSAAPTSAITQGLEQIPDSRMNAPIPPEQIVLREAGGLQNEVAKKIEKLKATDKRVSQRQLSDQSFSGEIQDVSNAGIGVVPHDDSDILLFRLSTLNSEGEDISSTINSHAQSPLLDSNNSSPDLENNQSCSSLPKDNLPEAEIILDAHLVIDDTQNNQLHAPDAPLAEAIAVSPDKWKKRKIFAFVITCVVVGIIGGLVGAITTREGNDLGKAIDSSGSDVGNQLTMTPTSRPISDNNSDGFGLVTSPSDFPSFLNFSTSSPTLCPLRQTDFTLFLLTDDYGFETSWTLVNQCTDEEIISRSKYKNQASILERYCIDRNAAYLFTIFDSEGDGICCEFGNGTYALTWDGVEVTDSDGAFLLEESITFGGYCESQTPSLSYAPSISSVPSSIPSQSLKPSTSIPPTERDASFSNEPCDDSCLQPIITQECPADLSLLNDCVIAKGDELCISKRGPCSIGKLLDNCIGIDKKKYSVYSRRSTCLKSIIELEASENYFGHVFDVVAKKDLIMTGFQLILDTEEEANIEIWTRLGPYVDHLNFGDDDVFFQDIERWTLVKNTTVQGEGSGTPTSVIHIDPIPVATLDGNGDGARRSFYITSPQQIILFNEKEDNDGNSDLEYGDNAYEDNFMRISVGTGVNHRFGWFGAPNILNGIIQYSPGVHGTCGDQHYQCLYWAGIGECDHNSVYMHTRCPDSCGLCSNFCGCESCTKEIFDTPSILKGLSSNCGWRVNWLLSQGNFTSQREACIQVAGVEFPDGPCGPFCNPELCHSIEVDPINPTARPTELSSSLSLDCNDACLQPIQFSNCPRDPSTLSNCLHSENGEFCTSDANTTCSIATSLDNCIGDGVSFSTYFRRKECFASDARLDATHHFHGHIFDIVAKENIFITGFQLHLRSESGENIEIWKKQGSYLDSITDANGGMPSRLVDGEETWSLVINSTVIGRGRGTVTPVIHVDPIFIAKRTNISNDRLSFYITSPNQVVYFTEIKNGDGDNVFDYGQLAYENNFLEYSVGTGVDHRFGWHGNPNVFNGRIQYSPDVLS